MDELQPQQIPSEILRRPQAINLYFIAVLSLAIIGVLAGLGRAILAWAGKVVPGEVWTFAGLAVGGLVALVGSDRGE